MQTTTSTLAAAAAATGERKIATKVTLDPARTGNPEANDYTSLFTEWDVDREIVSDVPPNARMVAGYVVAEFTGTAAGSATIAGGMVSGASKWSPFALGGVSIFPTGTEPENCLMRVRSGCVTSAGVETLPQFTGYIRELDVDAQAREATLVGLDPVSQMTDPVNLPIMGGSFQDPHSGTNRGNRPGLDCGSILDFALRQNGFYATPPPRTGCLLSVPGHGTLYPEPGYGTLWAGSITSNVTNGAYEQQTSGTYTADSGTAVSFDHVGAFGGGPFGDNGQSGITPSQVPICTGTTGTHKDYTACYAPIAGRTFNTDFASGKSITVESWVFIPATPPQGLPSTQPMFGIRFSQYPSVSTPATYHLMSIGMTASGAGYCSIGSGFTIQTGATTATQGWVYFKATVTFGASTTAVKWQINNETVQTATVAAVPAVGQVSTGPWFATLQTNRTNVTTQLTGEITSFEGLQVTTEANPASNYLYAPNAFCDYSLAPLTICPPSDPDTPMNGQQIIQDICIAEAGVGYCNELGQFYFFNRNRWSRSPGNTSQATVSNSNALEAMQISRTIDGVINHIKYNYSPYAIQLYQQAAQSQHIVGVHSNSTIVWNMDLGNPVVALDDNSGNPLPALPGGGSGYSSFRACRTPDGTGAGVDGTNLFVTIVQLDADTIQVTIVNNNAFPVYMVDAGGGTPGAPGIRIQGRPVIADNGLSTGDGDGSTVVEVTDATSINKYGDREYESSTTQWCQSQIVATAVAGDLLAQLKDVHPLVQNVTIKAIPGLQLGDRITLLEVGGTQINNTAVVVGLKSSGQYGPDSGGSGWKQDLTLRMT